MVFRVARYESGVGYHFQQFNMAEIQDGGQNGRQKRPIPDLKVDHSWMQGMLYVLHMVFVVARYESGVQFQFRESKMAEIEDGGQNGDKNAHFQSKIRQYTETWHQEQGTHRIFPHLHLVTCNMTGFHDRWLRLRGQIPSSEIQCRKSNMASEMDRKRQ